MSSRRFFDYDPYEYEYDPYDYNCYYTAAPNNYPYDVYYQRLPVPTLSCKSGGIFAGAEPAAVKPTPRERERKTSFSIPVHGPDSDPKPERERERKAAAPVGARAEPVAPAMSAEEAAVRMQAAARGFLARKSVRAVREVQWEAEQVRVKMVSEAEALVADPRASVAVGKALMRMLLRLDAVRGAREYRRRVTKRVLALQDAVDALETKPAPAPAPAFVGEEAEANAPEAMVAEMAEESAVPPEQLDGAERGSEMENIKNAVHTTIQMDVDKAIAAGEPEAKAAEEEEKEVVPGDANVDVDEPEDWAAEGEWEMVTEENEHAAPVAATSDDPEPPRKEPAYPLETTRTASAGAASYGVDARKVMEMVAALCEQSAKQCTVIGALAERVDALEHTVRRMEDAESCRW
ncbi:unnamed protein product [Miscanthus lutarioriparius]|uniref:BAG domain-containing protein n=1 Tax=Miscanthus lutarioriparius TaxID=422564 RepID=A0A811SND1_9POAL|nr:unnamed protein product [Miscanthus lutarioriparius]